MSATIAWAGEEFTITGGKWTGPVSVIQKMLQIFTDSDRFHAWGRYDPNPDANDAQRAADQFDMEFLRFDKKPPLVPGTVQ